MNSSSVDESICRLNSVASASSLALSPRLPSLYVATNSSARTVSMNGRSFRRNAASQSCSSCMRICWSDFTVLVWATVVVTAERRARRPKSVWRQVIDSYLQQCLFELGDDGARLPFHELFG